MAVASRGNLTAEWSPPSPHTSGGIRLARAKSFAHARNLSAPSKDDNESCGLEYPSFRVDVLQDNLWLHGRTCEGLGFRGEFLGPASEVRRFWSMLHAGMSRYVM